VPVICNQSNKQNKEIRTIGLDYQRNMLHAEGGIHPSTTFTSGKNGKNLLEAD